LNFLRKFTEIFTNYCLLPLSTTPVINCSAVSTTPAKNLLPVSLTPAVNLCHGFSVIDGVVDTGEQFIAGDNDIGEQLSPVTTTPAINLLSVTRTRTPWRWGAAKDRRKLKGINRRYLRPPDFSPVSLTPLNSLSPVSLTMAINNNSRISPRIFKKIRNGPYGILRGRGTLIYEKKLKLKISCQTPFKSCFQWCSEF
jgi:hypothetical protein